MVRLVLAVLLLAGCGGEFGSVESKSSALLPSGTYSCSVWDDPWPGQLLLIRQDAAWPSGTYDGSCLGVASNVSFYVDGCPGCTWPDGIALNGNYSVRFKARRGLNSFQGVFLGNRNDGNQGLNDVPWYATWWQAPNGSLYVSPVTPHRVGNAVNWVW
jgi:hypothetical protein